MIGKYYNTNKLKGTSQLQKAMEKLNFNGDNEEDYISNFSIIDKSKTISIFVEKDGKAEELFNEYHALLKINGSFNSDNIINLKQELYGYIISVYANKMGIINMSKVSDNFYIIHKNCLKNAYDNETGIKYNDKEAIFI